MAMDEEGSEIQELDRDDRLRILTELQKHPHPLTHQSDSLYDILNGQVVSETKVNVHDAVDIWQGTRTSFANGARQCALDYSECTHFREATQSQIPMEEESCPPCKYSLKRTSTNLIQFCGRTVLLGETFSQRPLLLSVPQL